jgi:F-type H+-transporting ATPase subunit epsilon
MSEKMFTLTLVTPDGAFLEGVEATAVNAQGSEGDFNARPGHEPFLTALKDTSEMWYRAPDGTAPSFYLEGGFIEVLPERVSIMANFACSSADMSKEDFSKSLGESKDEIQKKLEEAKKVLTERGKIEIEELELQLQKTITRLQYSAKKREKK